MTTKKGGLSKDTGAKRRSEELPEPFLQALKEIDDKTRMATEALRKVEMVRRMPLPQILDEMDDNIRAAAEAARNAEEAAKAAKQVTEMAIEASYVAGNLAEEAGRAGVKAAETATRAAAEAAAKAEEAASTIRATEALMLQRIESLEERLATVEASLPTEKVIILREISKEDAEKEISKLFSESQTLYYSDIAERLRLNLQLVVEICNELQSRGEIEVVDDALRSR